MPAAQRGLSSDGPHARIGSHGCPWRAPLARRETTIAIGLCSSSEVVCWTRMTRMHYFSVSAPHAQHLDLEGACSSTLFKSRGVPGRTPKVTGVDWNVEAQGCALQWQGGGNAMDLPVPSEEPGVFPSCCSGSPLPPCVAPMPSAQTTGLSETSSLKASLRLSGDVSPPRAAETVRLSPASIGRRDRLAWWWPMRHPRAGRTG